jgi:hypothetical protein
VSELPPIDPVPGPPPIPPGPPVVAEPPLPWEDPNAGIGSFFPTTGLFLTGPHEAFGRMSLTVDLVRPIAYFVIWVLLGTALELFWRYALWSPDAMKILEMFPKDILEQVPWITKLIERPTLMTVAVILVIAPLVGLIRLFVWSGIVHLTLALVGGAPKGFATTLRVMSYSETPSIAIAVPFVGPLIRLVWGLVLQIMGLSRAHRVSGGKAALGVLLPLAVCCGCIAVILFMAASSVAGLMKG